MLALDVVLFVGLCVLLAWWVISTRPPRPPKSRNARLILVIALMLMSALGYHLLVGGSQPPIEVQAPTQEHSELQAEQNLYVDGYLSTGREMWPRTH